MKSLIFSLILLLALTFACAKKDAQKDKNKEQKSTKSDVNKEVPKTEPPKQDAPKPEAKVPARLSPADFEKLSVIRKEIIGQIPDEKRDENEIDFMTAMDDASKGLSEGNVDNFRTNLIKSILILKNAKADNKAIDQLYSSYIEFFGKAFDAKQASDLIKELSTIKENIKSQK